MVLNVVVQMDYIEIINIVGDSVFVMMLEVQVCEYVFFYYMFDWLVMCGDDVYCMFELVMVCDEKGNYFLFGEKKCVNMCEMDVVLMCQDLLFDFFYIVVMYILDKIYLDVLVVNDLMEVCNVLEKLFVIEFVDLMFLILIIKDCGEIDLFCEEFGDIVMKLLFGYGGVVVFWVMKDDFNYGLFYDFFVVMFCEFWVIQQFLFNVKYGDKCILLVDGEFVGVVNWVLVVGDLCFNMVCGGVLIDSDFIDWEWEICVCFGLLFKKKGFILVGIDVIDGKLMEINVIVLIGICVIQNFGGLDVVKMVWDVLEVKWGVQVKKNFYIFVWRLKCLCLDNVIEGFIWQFLYVEFFGVVDFF